MTTDEPPTNYEVVARFLGRKNATLYNDLRLAIRYIKKMNRICSRQDKELKRLRRIAGQDFTPREL